MTMNLSPSESSTTECCPVLAKGRLTPELWPAPCTSRTGDTSCRLMRTACVSRTSTHLLKSLQGLGQIRTEVWTTYSGSNLFPRVPAPPKISNRTVASSWRYVGSHSSTTGTTGSAEPHWCPTASEHCRASALLSRKHRQDSKYTVQRKTRGEERAKGSALLFSSHWKQAEQSLCTTHSRVPASLPCKNQQKA